LWEVAEAAAWDDAAHPGEWTAVARTFRDGHTETWWALEVIAGPYGPEQAKRAVVATTDPTTLPALSNWYLVTNLPAPNAPERETIHPVADLAEVVRLYGLRNWVEQSYKQVKQALGWAQYQVRSDRAIRRHWQLVCCAFSFCWWAAEQGGEAMTAGEPDEDAMEYATPATEPVAGRGGNGGASATTDLVAGGITQRAGMAGTVDTAEALVAGVERSAPAARVAAAA
jgi:hypothetical protein